MSASSSMTRILDPLIPLSYHRQTRPQRAPTIIDSMAQVLISEPNADVCRLFEHMVGRLGHEPIPVQTLAPEIVASADVLLVETVDPAGAALARLAHSMRPTLPIICASIAPPMPELGLVPTASLLKPFTLGQLRETLEAAFPGQRPNT